jgi:hypothetical protein
MRSLTQSRLPSRAHARAWSTKTADKGASTRTALAGNSKQLPLLDPQRLRELRIVAPDLLDETLGVLAAAAALRVGDVELDVTGSAAPLIH